MLQTKYTSISWCVRIGKGEERGKKSVERRGKGRARKMSRSWEWGKNKSGENGNRKVGRDWRVSRGERGERGEGRGERGLLSNNYLCIK